MELLKNYQVAKVDLIYLIENGKVEKRAKYYNDLAFVEEQLDNLNEALTAQRTAVSFSPNTEQSELYSSKVENLNKKIGGNGVDANGQIGMSKAIIQIQEEKRGYCDFNIIITIGDKSFNPLVDRIDVSDLKPGTYSYEITGDITCNQNKWEALGKGTINIRGNSVYNLYYKKNEYKQCEMWISNY